VWHRTSVRTLRWKIRFSKLCDRGPILSELYDTGPFSQSSATLVLLVRNLLLRMFSRILGHRTILSDCTILDLLVGICN